MDLNPRYPTRETRALPIRPPRPVRIQQGYTCILYVHVCVYIYTHSTTSLNRPATGPTLNGPFREAVGIGVRISLQWY